MNAMVFNPLNGVLLTSLNDGSAGTGPNYLGTLNTSTGVGTQVGQSVNGLDALAFQSAAVPEPTSLTLLGAGFGMMGLAGWRRRRKTQSSNH